MLAEFWSEYCDAPSGGVQKFPLDLFGCDSGANVDSDNKIPFMQNAGGSPYHTKNPHSNVNNATIALTNWHVATIAQDNAHDNRKGKFNKRRTRGLANGRITPQMCEVCG